MSVSLEAYLARINAEYLIRIDEHRVYVNNLTAGGVLE